MTFRWTLCIVLREQADYAPDHPRRHRSDGIVAASQSCDVASLARVAVRPTARRCRTTSLEPVGASRPRPVAPAADETRRAGQFAASSEGLGATPPGPRGGRRGTRNGESAGASAFGVDRGEMPLVMRVRPRIPNSPVLPSPDACLLSLMMFIFLCCGGGRTVRR